MLNKIKILTLLGLIIIGILASVLIPYLITKSQIWLVSYNPRFIEIFQGIQNNIQQYAILLVVISFIYGVLHALGPGHGKLVMSSYALIHDKKRKELVILSLIASLLQGIMAIVLVGIGAFVLNLFGRQITGFVSNFEKISWILLIILGIYWIYRGSKKLVSLLTHKKNHHHHQNCNCGTDKLKKVVYIESIYEKFILILSVAIRPCTGNIFVLIFALVNSIWWWGVVSSLVMGIGTGITVATLTFLVITYKRQFTNLFNQKHQSQSLDYISSILFFFVGIFIIVFSILALSNTTQIIRSVI